MCMFIIIVQLQVVSEMILSLGELVQGIKYVAMHVHCLYVLLAITFMFM